MNFYRYLWLVVFMFVQTNSFYCCQDPMEDCHKIPTKNFSKLQKKLSKLDLSVAAEKGFDLYMGCDELLSLDNDDFLKMLDGVNFFYIEPNIDILRIKKYQSTLIYACWYWIDCNNGEYETETKYLVKSGLRKEIRTAAENNEYFDLNDIFAKKQNTFLKSRTLCEIYKKAEAFIGSLKIISIQKDPRAEEFFIILEKKFEKNKERIIGALDDYHKVNFVESSIARIFNKDIEGYLDEADKKDPLDTDTLCTHLTSLNAIILKAVVLSKIVIEPFDLN